MASDVPATTLKLGLFTAARAMSADKNVRTVSTSARTDNILPPGKSLIILPRAAISFSASGNVNIPEK
ncbi:hypothetical protein D3C86_1679330 [compost metagenome]